MSRKKKLTQDMIPQIVEMVKLRMPWVMIASALGFTDKTLQRWRTQGLEDRENGKSTNCRKLVEALETARKELIKGYSVNVRNEALHGKETVTTEVVEHKDGSIYEKTTTKKEPPNATLALKILGMELPEIWAENHNLNVNWQETLKAQDHDPDKIKEMIKTYLENRKKDNESDTEESDDADTTTDDTT